MEKRRERLKGEMTMTIAGWIIFIAIAVSVAFFGFLVFVDFSSAKSIAFGSIVTLTVIVLIYSGFHWYFNNTASGQRQLIDQKSNLNGGIERVVNVYTANGDVIARYEGKIDIDTNAGGYVKFDFEGNRYIYYNCFVETIARID